MIEVTGEERLRYVHNLATNSIEDLADGEGRRAFMLSPTKGRVLADFLACETESALWLECAEGSSSTVMELFRKYYFGQNVEFEDRADEWWLLSLQGPAAEEILASIGIALPSEGEGSHVEGGVPDWPMRVVRWSDFGGNGFHLWIDQTVAGEVERRLKEEGAVGAENEAVTALRIEAGTAVFGRELTEEIIPLEAPTENAISHTKGCYPGQEVIARLHMRGRPARHLRGLEIEGSEELIPGTVLDAPDKVSVARVTSGGVSPVLGPIALAYVQRDYCEAGTVLSAGGRKAVVVDLPMTGRSAGDGNG